MTTKTIVSTQKEDQPLDEDGWPTDPPALKGRNPGKGGVDGYGTSLARIARDIDQLIHEDVSLRFRHYGMKVKETRIDVYIRSPDIQAATFVAGTETTRPRCNIQDPVLKRCIQRGAQKRYKALRDFIAKWS